MAYLVLSNGMTFEGKRIGAPVDRMGELVFTTGMVGYLETLTDPSYYGQLVVQTFPLIGNYGIIEEDFEGESALFGYIVRELCDMPSNFRCQYDVNTYLVRHGIPGLCGVDTREITRITREEGVMNAMICDTVPSDLSALRAFKTERPVQFVTRKKITIYPALSPKRKRVVLMDFGVKQNIIRSLRNLGCEVVAVPADTGSIIYDVRQWPVEVLVSDAGDGVLRSHVRYQDPVGGQENEQAAEFLNRVKPGKLRVGKVAVGMTDAAADVRFLFRIDLSDADGNELLDGEGAPLAFAYKIIGQADNDSASALTDALGAPRVGSIASGGQVLLGSRESLLVEGLPAGASYSVVELPTDGFQLVSHDGERGRIEADATAQARFNNVYRAEGSAVLRAHKTLLNGEEPMEVLGERTFTFELRDEFGEVVDSRTTGIDGSVEFEALQFSAADVGSTYTYFIREVDDGQQSVVYDTHSEKVMVSVSDPDGTGVLKVDVLYAAQLEAILAGETPDVNYIPEFVNIYDESFNLPETGGPGAFAPLLAGLALSAASLVLLRRRYRQAP